MKYGINRLIVLIIVAFYIYTVKLSGLIFKRYICREAVDVNRAVVHISVRIHNRNIRTLIRPDIANSVLSRLKEEVFLSIYSVGLADLNFTQIVYICNFKCYRCFGILYIIRIIKMRAGFNRNGHLFALCRHEDVFIF